MGLVGDGAVPMIRPGSVVWVEFDPVTGGEQGGRRPALVVSSEEHLGAATTLVTVVPATSKDRGWPNHVAMIGATGLPEPAFAMTEQVRTISRERVADAVGHVDAECFKLICQWVHRWLAPR